MIGTAHVRSFTCKDDACYQVPLPEGIDLQDLAEFGTLNEEKEAQMREKLEKIILAINERPGEFV